MYIYTRTHTLEPCLLRESNHWLHPCSGLICGSVNGFLYKLSDYIKYAAAAGGLSGLFVTMEAVNVTRFDAVKGKITTIISFTA